MKDNMKSNTVLNILHLINILISVYLIILSILSFFCIDKGIITYAGNMEETIFIYRVLLSSIVFLGSVGLMIIGLLPDKKHSKGHWNWWIALIVLISAFTVSYFLFDMSVADNSIDYNLIELFNYSFSTSMYNRLAIMMLIGFSILTFLSLLWRIIANHIRNEEIYLKVRPEIVVIMAFMIVIVLVAIGTYFNMSEFEVYILCVVVFAFIGLIENKLNVTVSKRKNRVHQKFTFEEANNINQLRYYYNFGGSNDDDEDNDVEIELCDYEQFNEELKSFKTAQEEKDLSKVQPVVNVWIKDGNINGITMISARYDLFESLFSNRIIVDEFKITVRKKDEYNEIKEYFCSMEDYEELEKIFYEFVVNHRTPVSGNFYTIN